MDPCRFRAQESGHSGEGRWPAQWRAPGTPLSCERGARGCERRAGRSITNKRLQLIHWNASEAAELARRLRALGYRVREAIPSDAAELRALGDSPPHAVVIDLSRLPSQGRDVGVLLRRAARTRAIPLVFVGGRKEKIAEVRKVLPDATYTTWVRIEGALKRALHPALRPLEVPGSVMAGYSETPLPRKLGVKPGSRVALLGAPPDFARTLGPLPDGAVLSPRIGARTTLAIWFVRSLRQLEAAITRRAGEVPRDGLWIAWPKKSSGVRADLGEADVRRLGLAQGLVDYKICAIDSTWAALKFAVRGRSG